MSKGFFYCREHIKKHAVFKTHPEVYEPKANLDVIKRKKKTNDSEAKDTVKNNFSTKGSVVPSHYHYANGEPFPNTLTYTL